MVRRSIGSPLLNQSSSPAAASRFSPRPFASSPPLRSSIQRVEDKDALNIYKKYITKKNVDKIGSAKQLWAQLAENIDSEELKSMTVNAAVAWLAEHNALATSAVAVKKEEPQPFMKPDIAVERMIEFNVEGLGSGVLGLYTAAEAGPKYKDMLTWVSHGYHISNDLKPSAANRAFGFLLESGKSLIRPSEEDAYLPFLNTLEEKKEDSGFALGKNVPDVAVNPHAEGLQASDAAAMSKSLPLADMAILWEFQWAKEVAEEYLPYRNLAAVEAPPLDAFLDKIPELSSYSSLLMVVCRTTAAQMQSSKAEKSHSFPESTLKPFKEPEG